MANDTKHWKRWTESEAREVLEAASRSGKTLREYGLSRGFGARRLDRWARRLGFSPEHQEEQVSFEEIVPVRAASREPFEVVLASGRMVRVPPAFDADSLGRLLDLLERAAC